MNEVLSSKLRGQRSNAQGKFFEQCIEAACIKYSLDGVAEITKVPEPFRVIKKEKAGKFRGQFIKKAQPDFSGTLKNGKSVVFEAKFTLTDKLKQSVLTETQNKALKKHEELGAISGVCAGIQDEYYFIPYSFWSNMHNILGRKYITKEDVQQYKVKFNGAVLFLDYVEAAV